MKISTMRRQHGNFLITAAISVAVMGLVGIGSARNVINKTNEAVGATHGRLLADVQGVVGTYLTTYYATLSNNGSISGVANPLAPTVVELQALGLTNANLSMSAAQGGAYNIVITKVPSTCVAPNCNLTAKIWYANPFIDTLNNRIDLAKLGAAVAAGNGDIGYSLPSAPGTIAGSGGWSTANPDPAQRPGILAAVTGYGATGLSQYLRRDGSDAGMVAPLRMNFQPIEQAGYITANGLGTGGTVTAGTLAVNGNATVSGAQTVGGTQTVGGNQTVSGSTVSNGYIRPSAGAGQTATNGSACSEGNGAIRAEASGIILSCQNGTWRPSASSVNTGIRGVFQPQAGKTIACSAGGSVVGAHIEPDGTPYICFGNNTACSSWPGLGNPNWYQQMEFINSSMSLSLTATKLTYTWDNSPPQTCTAYWPNS